jgi:hypothetical protein
VKDRIFENTESDMNVYRTMQTVTALKIVDVQRRVFTAGITIDIT